MKGFAGQTMSGWAWWAGYAWKNTETCNQRRAGQPAAVRRRAWMHCCHRAEAGKEQAGKKGGRQADAAMPEKKGGVRMRRRSSAVTVSCL